MKQHQIFLIGGEDDEKGTLIEEGDYGNCRLTFMYRGKQIAAESSDYFEALCAIRLELEKEGLIPFCYGASLNVFPSRMSKQMSGGRSAYKIEIGKQSAIEDLVCIFDEGLDIIPASVNQQREYFGDWLASEKI